jgi:hypothetical protein
MFDHLQDRLKGMQNIRIPASMPVDANGDIDRRCPNASCAREFKVNFQDFKALANDSYLCCPHCGHKALPTDWNTPEQSEYLKKQALNYVKKEIASAMNSDVSNFNSSAPKGFITMTLSYRPGAIEILVPPRVADELSHHHQCAACKLRYSLIGTAYFCPGCSKPTPAATVGESLGLIRTFIDRIDTLKAAFRSAYDEVETEKAVSLMIEEHFCRIVSLLQKHCEDLFEKSPKPSNLVIRKNLFQNLQESSAVWRTVHGKGYEDILDAQRYQRIKLYYQQRHLLVHTGGIVDAEYVANTNDAQYSVGQRIMIMPKVLAEFLQLSLDFMKSMDANFQ